MNECTLSNLIKYLDNYADKEFTKLPTQLESTKLEDELEEWNFKFLTDLSFEQTFNLINAAEYIQLPHLHDLACVKIAAFMKDKEPDDVNKEFTIECQLTSDEAKNLGLDVNEEHQNNNN